MPLGDLQIAASDEDQRQQIDLLVDIEPGDEIAHLLTPRVVARIVLDRHQLAVVAGRGAVARGRGNLAGDLAGGLDELLDLGRTRVC